MFLSQLKFKQKRFFLNLANQLLRADGAFDESEADYLRSICAEMSLSNEDVENCVLDQIKELFVEPEEKRILLIETLALALCNGEYAEEEKKIIEKVANELELQSDINGLKNLIETHFINQRKLIDYILK